MDLKNIFADAPAGAGWYGVVGSGIGYTLSPAMHTAAMKRYGLKAVYRKIDIPVTEWDSFRSQIDLLNGFNITQPFKEKALEIGRGVSGVEVGTLGAVNTAYRPHLHWQAINTDVEGFLSDAISEGFRFSGRRVLVLGAGGAARAVLSAILPAGALRESLPVFVGVANRTPERAEAMIVSMGLRMVVDVRPVEVGHTFLTGAPANFDVLINATRVGSRPNDVPLFDPKNLLKSQDVYDLVYNRETELLRTARQKGCRAAGGLGMLVNQGALAFELWFGEELKKLKYDTLELRRVMRGAAENALKEKP